MAVRGKKVLAGRETEKKKRGPGKFKERVLKEAKEQGLSLEDQQAAVAEAGGTIIDVEYNEVEQQQLPGTESTEIPKTVRNGQMLVNFVRAKLDRDKEERTLGFEISFPLTEDHEGELPKSIEAGWKALQKLGLKRVDVNGVPLQSIWLRLSPDNSEPEFTANGMTIPTASIQLIEETGTGEAVDIVRLHFTAWMTLERKALEFAANNFGNQFWLTIARTQSSLLED